MKLLVIGGTQFIGRHFVEDAVARGHEVTLFNRGSRPAPEGVAETIIGDRDTDLLKLADRGWDAMIDTSAYVPRQVREAARILEKNVDHYLFISTISVYRDTTEPYVDEDSELIRLEDATVEEVNGSTYGGLKVLCEEELAKVYPEDRRLVIRPCIVVGPEDPTDRFTYWVARMHRGGEILAPRGPALPLQWIDARDLAAWMTRSLEHSLAGTYNAVSEADRFDMGSLLAAAKEASEKAGGAVDAKVTWVDEHFLRLHEVRPFADLPFWLPEPSTNMFRIDHTRGHEAGLTIRPVEQTVRDTLAWHRERGEPELKVGLDPEREREVLEAWRTGR